MRLFQQQMFNICLRAEVDINAQHKRLLWPLVDVNARSDLGPQHVKHVKPVIESYITDQLQ